jgi:hypothetical protein
MTNRRALLTGLARIGALGVAASSLWPHTGIAVPAGDAAAARLRSALSNAAGARHIGNIYLQQVSTESGSKAALDALLASLALAPEQVLRLGRRALTGIIQQRMRKDFQTGDRIVVGGWIISRTEARLCALWT